MRNNAKSYRKYMATGVSAAMVATVGAPIATTHVSAAAASDFSDVNANAWYYDHVEYLNDKGVLGGYPDGTLRPSATLTRAEAAAMIVASLGITVSSNATLDFSDTRNGVWYTGPVAALVERGVINGFPDGTFRPHATITRAEFAAMVVSAYGITGATNPNNNTFPDVVSGSWYEGSVMTLAGHGIVGGLPNGKFAPNATVLRSESAAFLHRTEVPEERLNYEGPGDETPELAVQSVRAVTPSSVEINFTQPVESLAANDVVIRDANTGGRIYAESVTLADDGQSATVQLYNALSSGITYGFSVNTAGETLTYDFAFELTDVAEIVIEDQYVPANRTSQLEYNVYDENGVNLTNEVDVSFRSPSSAVNPNTGEVSGLAAGTSTTVQVVYTNGDHVVESETITITSVDAVPTTLSNYTITNAEGSANFAAGDYEQVTDVYAGGEPDYLNIQFQDRFGNIYNPAAAGNQVVFESLNTNVAVIDRNTGQIQPFTTGTLPIRVSVIGDNGVLFSETVQVNVNAERAANEISLESNTVTLSSLDTVGVTLDAEVLDQYGRAFDAAIVPQQVDGLTVTYENGQLFVVNNNAAEGNYTVELGVANSDVTAELNVRVVEPGQFASYQVRGLPSSFDLNSNTTTSNLSVVAVDSNGLFIQDETTNATYTVRDANGNEVVASTGTNQNGELVLDAAALNGIGTYTIAVRLNNAVIETTTFEVIDTTVPPQVTFTSSTINAAVGNTLGDRFNDIATISHEGSTIAEAVVTDLEFVSSNDAVVNDNDGGAAVLAEGSATIYVTSVTVDLDNTNPDNAPTTIDFDSPQVFTVNVQ